MVRWPSIRQSLPRGGGPLPHGLQTAHARLGIRPFLRVSRWYGFMRLAISWCRANTVTAERLARRVLVRVATSSRIPTLFAQARTTKHRSLARIDTDALAPVTRGRSASSGSSPSRTTARARRRSARGPNADRRRLRDRWLQESRDRPELQRRPIPTSCPRATSRCSMPAASALASMVIAWATASTRGRP